MMYFLTRFGPRITLPSYKCVQFDWISYDCLILKTFTLMFIGDSVSRRHVAGCKMAMVQVMEWRDESSGQANLLGKVQIPGQGWGVFLCVGAVFQKAQKIMVV